MESTKKHKADVAKAMRVAKAGSAYHWPTVAAILADEVERLQKCLEETELPHNREGE